MAPIRIMACALCAALLLAVIPSARCEAVDDTRLFITQHINAYGLMDASGNAASPQYPFIEDLYDAQGGDATCYVYYERDAVTGSPLAGVLDAQGHVLLEARFNHIALEYGMLLTEEGDPDAPLCAAYTPDGKAILPPKNGWLSFTGALIRRGLETQAVYYYSDGKPAPTFNKYAYISGETGGLCVAGDGGKYGYIDAQGNARIPFIYDSASDFTDGKYASVITGEDTYIIDTGGGLVYGPTPMYMYFDGVCWVGNCAGRAILMDAELNTLEEIIDEHAYISGDCGYYMINGSAGTRFVDAKGAPALPGAYSSAESIGEGLFCVTYEGEGDDAHVVRADGSELFTLPGLLTAYVKGGYIVTIVERRGQVRYGLHSLDGAQLLPSVYRRLAPVQKDVIDAQLLGDSGYIRPDGTWLYRLSKYEKLID